MLVLCVPASAEVVEAARGAASSVPGGIGAAPVVVTIPPASILAPSLTVGGAPVLPQSSVSLAPPVPAPAAAATPQAQQAPGTPSASTRQEGLPPERQESAREDILYRRAEAASVPEVSAQVEETGRAPIEGAASVGRRVWDQSSDHAGLETVIAAPTAEPGTAAAASGYSLAGERGARLRRARLFASPSPRGESLRDAVASPAPLAAVAGRFLVPQPGSVGAAPTTRSAASSARQTQVSVLKAPTLSSLNRLSLELGSGLVVRVRTVLSLSAASLTRLAVMPGAAAVPADIPRTGAPLTSTEWLERRGLLETLSASEAAAGEVALPFVPGGPASGRSSGIFMPLRPASSAPAAPVPFPPFFWGLAFLPAAAALLRELL